CPLLYSEIRRTNLASCPTNLSGYATPEDLADAVQAAEAAAAANEVAGLPPARRYPSSKGTTVDVFSVVERFAFQRTFPSDMVYWSSIVMRNNCRRDETRDGLRQCSYLKCQKWERQQREFAKCRRCRKAKYCSKQCQSRAWAEGHRNWCTERNPTGGFDDAHPDATVQHGADPSAAGAMVAMTNEPAAGAAHHHHNHAGHVHHQHSHATSQHTAVQSPAALVGNSEAAERSAWMHNAAAAMGDGSATHDDPRQQRAMAPGAAFFQGSSALAAPQLQQQQSSSSSQRSRHPYARPTNEAPHHAVSGRGRLRGPDSNE
ncbi:hypothetical protein FBU59_004107, partial [Linderina macrospora]